LIVVMPCAGGLEVDAEIVEEDAVLGRTPTISQARVKNAARAARADLAGLDDVREQRATTSASRRPLGRVAIAEPWPSGMLLVRHAIR